MDERLRVRAPADRPGAGIAAQLDPRRAQAPGIGGQHRAEGGAAARSGRQHGALVGERQRDPAAAPAQRARLEKRGAGGDLAVRAGERERERREAVGLREQRAPCRVVERRRVDALGGERRPARVVERQARELRPLRHGPQLRLAAIVAGRGGRCGHASDPLPLDQPPAQQPRDDRQLGQPGHRIVAREDRRLARAAQRAQVLAQRQPARQQLAESGRGVGRDAQPADALAGGRPRHRVAADQLPQQPREVDARAAAERVPAPDARVHVQQQHLPRPRVPLVLDLDQAGPADRARQPQRRLDDLGHLDGLDVGAGAAEVGGVLARPPRRQPGQRLAVAAQRRERELRVAPAGDDSCTISVAGSTSAQASSNLAASSRGSSARMPWRP